MNIRAELALLLLCIAAAGAAQPANAVEPTTRPAAEAAAQKMLPKAHDELWSKLIKCAVKYDEKAGTYGITLTPEVKALDGQVVTVKGFVLPMDGSDRTRHFLISRNTPVCLYCPPGEPNEVIEVRAPQGVEWSEKITTVRGKLHLIDDEEKALFFRIENAEAK
jgi:hypothetical protein